MWEVRTSVDAEPRCMEYAELVELALECGYPPGDYIFEKASVVRWMRAHGWSLTHLPPTEYETLDVSDTDW